MMASPVFSSAVVNGMLRQGYDAPAIGKIAGLSPAKMKSVMSEKIGLTYRQLRAIEDAAGMTGGELAATYLEPNGGSLTAITSVIASARSTPVRRRRTTKKAG